MFITVQPEEFSICVNVDNLKLTPQGVFIVWEWEWSDSEPEEDESELENVSTCCSAEGTINPYLLSDSESEHEADTFVLPEITHTVVFKCIGATHNQQSQEVLSEAANLIKKGTEIPVKLMKEPENEFDSKAIAFHCKLPTKDWIKIGYVVREVLEHVHKALDEKKIMSVKFDWVKYLVIWSKSGPGFYAGIRVTLNGEWPKDVCRYQISKYKITLN